MELHKAATTNGDVRLKEGNCLYRASVRGRCSGGEDWADGRRRSRLGRWQAVKGNAVSAKGNAGSAKGNAVSAKGNAVSGLRETQFQLRETQFLKFS